MDATRGGTRCYLAGAVTSITSYFNVQMQVNKVHAMPMVFARDTTIVGLHVFVAALAAGTNIQLGIYDAIDDASDLYPHDLIVDGGSVSSASTGMKTAVINTTLTGGKLYWLVSVSDGTAWVRAKSARTYWPILGWSSTLWGTGGIGWVADLAFGALPATFPTAGSTATPASTNVPGLMYSMA